MDPEHCASPCLVPTITLYGTLSSNWSLSLNQERPPPGGRGGKKWSRNMVDIIREIEEQTNKRCINWKTNAVGDKREEEQVGSMYWLWTEPFPRGGGGEQYHFRDVEGVTVGGGWGHHLRVWLLDQNIEQPGLAGERTRWKTQQGHNRVEPYLADPDPQPCLFQIWILSKKLQWLGILLSTATV